LFRQVFPQPPNVEGHNCERSFRHESGVLGRPAGRSTPCGGLDHALSYVGWYLPLAQM
jgi:hypothetical protein